MYDEENKCITVCEKSCKPKRKCRCCIDVIIFVLSILFALTIGIILGVTLGAFITEALVALIVLAVILGILIIFYVNWRKEMYIVCRTSEIQEENMRKLGIMLALE